MVFCPKSLGVGRDLRIIILLKDECSFSGADMWGGADTQVLQDGKKSLNFAQLEVMGI